MKSLGFKQGTGTSIIYYWSQAISQVSLSLGILVWFVGWKVANSCSFWMCIPRILATQHSRTHGPWPVIIIPIIPQSFFFGKPLTKSLSMLDPVGSPATSCTGICCATSASHRFFMGILGWGFRWKWVESLPDHLRYSEWLGLFSSRVAFEVFKNRGEASVYNIYIYIWGWFKFQVI